MRQLGPFSVPAAGGVTRALSLSGGHGDHPYRTARRTLPPPRTARVPVHVMVSRKCGALVASLVYSSLIAVIDQAGEEVS